MLAALSTFPINYLAGFRDARVKLETGAGAVGGGIGPSTELVDRIVHCVLWAHQQKEPITRFHLLSHFCIWVEIITSFKLCSNFKNDGVFPGGMVCFV